MFKMSSFCFHASPEALDPMVLTQTTSLLNHLNPCCAMLCYVMLCYVMLSLIHPEPPTHSFHPHYVLRTV